MLAGDQTLSGQQRRPNGMETQHTSARTNDATHNLEEIFFAASHAQPRETLQSFGMKFLKLMFSKMQEILVNLTSSQSVKKPKKSFFFPQIHSLYKTKRAQIKLENATVRRNSPPTDADRFALRFCGVCSTLRTKRKRKPYCAYQLEISVSEAQKTPYSQHPTPYTPDTRLAKHPARSSKWMR